jgi:hypothetical protein
MTQRGTLLANIRQGINRTDTGALITSFEETVEILLEAAAAGEMAITESPRMSRSVKWLLWIQVYLKCHLTSIC